MNGAIVLLYNVHSTTFPALQVIVIWTGIGVKGGKINVLPANNAAFLAVIPILNHKEPPMKDKAHALLSIGSGYRSYVLAVVAGALTVAHALGYIDTETYTTLMGLTGAGGVATLRAGMKK